MNNFKVGDIVYCPNSKEVRIVRKNEIKYKDIVVECLLHAVNDFGDMIDLRLATKEEIENWNNMVLKPHNLKYDFELKDIVELY